MANRTYRYFTGKPLYGFGYGLSYSQFQYGNPKLSSPSVKAGDPVTVEVDVKNISSRAGDEVVQLYLTQPKAALTPLRTLGGFTRVHVEPGETAHVAIQIDPRTLGQVDEKGERVVLPGTYSVAVGGAQPAEFPGAVTATLRGHGIADPAALTFQAVFKSSGRAPRRRREGALWSLRGGLRASVAPPWTRSRPGRPVGRPPSTAILV